MCRKTQEFGCLCHSEEPEPGLPRDETESHCFHILEDCHPETPLATKAINVFMYMTQDSLNTKIQFQASRGDKQKSEQVGLLVKLLKISLSFALC